MFFGEVDRESDFYWIDLNDLNEETMKKGDAEWPKMRNFGVIEPSKFYNSMHLLVNKTYQCKIKACKTNSKEALEAVEVVCTIEKQGGAVQLWLNSIINKLWERSSIAHPSLLGTMSQIHRWPFGALAELIHNSKQANSTEVRINYKTFHQTRVLMVADNGHGMDPVGLHHMLTFGKPSHQIEKGGIGRYGVGFKTGSMRLGKAALVITKQKGIDFVSIGFYSQKYDSNTSDLKAHIIVYDKTLELAPSFSSEKDKTALFTALIQFKINETKFATILADQIGTGVDPGASFTNVYIIEPTPELLPSSEAQTKCPNLRFANNDIVLNQNQIPDVSNTFAREFLGFVPNLKQNVESGFGPGTDFLWSLRSYIQIMFKQAPSLSIVLEGSPIKLISINDYIEFDPDKFEDAIEGQGEQEVKVRYGFSSKCRELKVSGLYLYWNDVLISPLYYPIEGDVPGPPDFGIIGTAELKIRPANNKQEFDPTDENFAHVMGTLRNILENKVHDKLTKTRQSERKKKGQEKEPEKIEWVRCVTCRFFFPLDPKNASIPATQFTCTKIGLLCGELNLWYRPVVSDMEQKVASKKRDHREKIEDTRNPTPKASPLVTLSASDFEIDFSDRLGSSEDDSCGHHAVYKGSWNGNVVAIKVLDQLGKKADAQVRNQLERDVGPMIALRHPAIGQVYFTGIDSQDCLCIGMEYFPNSRTLRECAIKKIPFASANRLAMGLASAVAYLHRNQVYHNDLHPGNVLVIEADGDLSIKVIDFGISVFAKPSKKSSTQTQQILAAGVYAYCSMDKLKAVNELGKWEPTSQADVYATACLIGLLFTGKEPFSEEPNKTPSALLKRLDQRDAAPFPASFISDAKGHFDLDLERLDVIDYWCDLGGLLTSLHSAYRINTRNDLHKTLHRCWQSSQTTADALAKWFQTKLGQLEATKVDAFVALHKRSYVFHVIEDEASYQDLLQTKQLRSPATRNDDDLRRLVSVVDHVNHYDQHSEDSRYISATISPVWALFDVVTDILADGDSQAYVIKIDLNKVKNYFDLTLQTDRAMAFGDAKDQKMAKNNAVSAKEVIFEDQVSLDAIKDGQFLHFWRRAPNKAPTLQTLLDNIAKNPLFQTPPQGTERLSKFKSFCVYLEALFPGRLLEDVANDIFNNALTKPIAATKPKAAASVTPTTGRSAETNKKRPRAQSTSTKPASKMSKKKVDDTPSAKRKSLKLEFDDSHDSSDVSSSDVSSEVEISDSD